MHRLQHVRGGKKRRVRASAFVSVAYKSNSFRFCPLHSCSSSSSSISSSSVNSSRSSSASMADCVWNPKRQNILGVGVGVRLRCVATRFSATAFLLSWFS